MNLERWTSDIQHRAQQRRGVVSNLFCFTHLSHSHTSETTHTHTHHSLFSFSLAISFYILEIWPLKSLPWVFGQESTPSQGAKSTLSQSLDHCTSWTELEDVCLPRWRMSCEGSMYMIPWCSKPCPFQDLLGIVRAITGIILRNKS